MIESNMPAVVEGTFVVPPKTRFAIVASRFNDFIVDRLVGAAVDALVRHGVDTGRITVVRVPGSWEIPLACSKVASRHKADAIIAVSEAIAAEMRERNPHGSVSHISNGSDFDDFAHEFVAKNIAFFHERNVPVHQVQVRAADRASGPCRPRARRRYRHIGRG